MTRFLLDVGNCESQGGVRDLLSKLLVSLYQHVQTIRTPCDSRRLLALFIEQLLLKMVRFTLEHCYSEVLLECEDSPLYFFLQVLIDLPQLSLSQGCFVGGVMRGDASSGVGCFELLERAVKLGLLSH